MQHQSDQSFRARRMKRSDQRHYRTILACPQRAYALPNVDVVVGRDRGLPDSPALLEYSKEMASSPRSIAKSKLTGLADMYRSKMGSFRGEDCVVGMTCSCLVSCSQKKIIALFRITVDDAQMMLNRLQIRKRTVDIGRWTTYRMPT